MLLKVRFQIAALCSAAALAACGGAGSSAQPLGLTGAVPALQARSSVTATTWGGGGWHHRGFGFAGWRNLNLTTAQQGQLHQLMTQFRASHPRGTTVDLQTRQRFHQQMLAILTPTQQAQLKETVALRRDGPFANLNLSDAQRTQIRALMEQFRQTHPRGSIPDPQAREQLHQQIQSILTPEQRAMLPQPQNRMHG